MNKFDTSLMSPFAIDIAKKLLQIKDPLVEIAEKLLPKNSGQTKVLEIVVKITYEKTGYRPVKIVFWRPNNHMLVAYNFENFEIHTHNIGGKFEITANHDSTWKSDGLDFFKKIADMTEASSGLPEGVEIFSSKVVEVVKLLVDEDKGIFTYQG